MSITTDLCTQLSRKHKTTSNSKAAAAAAVLTGTGVAAFGLSRRNWAGLGIAAGGAVLAYQGITRIAPYTGAIRVSYTINKTPEELFNFVRDWNNWEKFSRGIEVGGREGDDLKLVLGRSFEFELPTSARITQEESPDFIAWSSLPGAVEHRGVMHFRPAPGDRGTELSVALEFKIPAAKVPQLWRMLSGQGPEHLLRENLRRLKQFIEAGEIPTTKGQPAGTRGLQGSALRVLYREPRGENIRREARIAGD